MKRKSINSSLAALLILLVTTIAADQLFFFSGKNSSISHLMSFPDCINTDDAQCINGINTGSSIYINVFTTIQLPKREL
jgi:hypothetical protein